MKKQRNVRKKSEQNLQKRRFPAYFRHFRPINIFFQKSDSATFWALWVRIFVQKSGKTIDEISRKCQKTGFSGIFPAFSAGKKCFSKIGLCHILGIANLQQCAKLPITFFWEKTKKYWEKVRWKFAKTAISGIFLNFSWARISECLWVCEFVCLSANFGAA